MSFVLDPTKLRQLNGFYQRSECREFVYRLYNRKCQGCRTDLSSRTDYVSGHIIARRHEELFRAIYPELDVDNLINLHLLCEPCNVRQSAYHIDSPFLLAQLFKESARALDLRYEKVAQGMTGSEALSLPSHLEQVEEKLRGMGLPLTLSKSGLLSLADERRSTSSHLFIPQDALQSAWREAREKLGNPRHLNWHDFGTAVTNALADVKCSFLWRVAERGHEMYRVLHEAEPWMEDIPWASPMRDAPGLHIARELFECSDVVLRLLSYGERELESQLHQLKAAKDGPESPSWRGQVRAIDNFCVPFQNSYGWLRRFAESRPELRSLELDIEVFCCDFSPSGRPTGLSAHSINAIGKRKRLLSALTRFIDEVDSSDDFTWLIYRPEVDKVFDNYLRILNAMLDEHIAATRVTRDEHCSA